MKKTLLLTMILITSCLFTDKQTCFSGLCNKMTKKDLQKLGYMPIWHPFSLTKKKTVKNIPVIETVSLKDKLICAYTITLPRNKKSFRLLLTQLKANQIETKQLEQYPSVGKIYKRISYGKYNETNSPLRITSFDDSHRLMFYFNDKCDPVNTIYKTNHN